MNQQQVNNFYAPGTEGYVYYKKLDGKIMAQWGGFDSSYQRYYFNSIEEMVDHYVFDEQRANFIINKIREE